MAGGYTARRASYAKCAFLFRDRLRLVTDPPMSWRFRPSLLLFLSLVLGISAGVLIYWTPAVETRPEPRPVAKGDQEIAFLYQATAASTWQRFVTAAKALDDWRGFKVDTQHAFPLETTAVSELIVSNNAAK